MRTQQPRHRLAVTPWVSTQAHPRTQAVKWSNRQRPPLKGELPRYVFNPDIGPGCKQHALADCLCDVTVSTETVVLEGPLLFAKLATDENGEPSRKNFGAWASTLLGCFEYERRLVEREDTNGIYWRLPLGGSHRTQRPGTTGWELLTPEIRDDLLWWTTQKVTFGKVKHLVPSTFTTSERLHVRKIFNHNKTLRRGSK